MGKVYQFTNGAGAEAADTSLTASLRHRIRLRDRLRVTGLRQDPERAAEICRQLRAQAGVRQLRYNRGAASITLEYHEEAAQQALPELLADIGIELREGRQRPSPVHTAPPEQQAATPPTEGSDNTWHVEELSAVLEALASDPEGLSPKEAERRLRQHGPNLLQKLERRGDWAILREQFQSAPVAMLGVSAAIALLSAAPLDASVIAVVVGANAAVGFLTERQAEDTIASMASIEGQRIKVIRGGEVAEVEASEVVRGDIMLLEPGTRLPADARLVRAHHLTVDESSLTGESLPVVKKAKDNPEAKVLADRHNMVHLGTVVSGGDGRAVVVNTGDETELGQIQSLASSSERPMTPMQERLQTVSTQLAVLSSGVCALVFAIGLLRGQPRLAMLNTAISLAVAAVPEGLPAISNSLLAVGIRRMRKKNVLARHLAAIENLGAIDVLCVDKTGTLTENRMTVVEVRTIGHRVTYADDDAHWQAEAEAIDKRLWKTLVLCSEAEQEDGEWQGSATEIALVQSAVRAGINVAALRKSMPRLRVRYRSERQPYMASVHRYPRKQGFFQAVKGRPSQLLARCTHLRRGSRRVRLTKALREEILAQNQDLMDQSYRVLGVAWRHVDGEAPGKLEGLEWLGLAALSDPLRPEVGDLIARLQQAGIRTIILTGDQRGTAAAIGRLAGLNGDSDVRVLGADELAEMSEGALLEEVKHTHVFARVSPAMKLKLVQALQKAGHRVAMTGDGINDGPALRVADVGIAMGKDGSDVARSMSDVVLADDRLQSIIDAIANGRSSFANLQKAIEYLLSTNFSEIQVTLGAIAAGLPTPLSPIQLLWINLMTDVFPSLAIGFEAPEWDVLKQPPDEFSEGVISRKRLGAMLQQSLIISGGTFASYLYGIARYGVGGRANTQAFMTLTTAQLLQALSSRSRSASLITGEGAPPNGWLKAAVGGSLAMQLAITLPGIRRIFGVTPIGPVDALVIAATALAPPLLNEYLKIAGTPDHGQER